MRRALRDPPFERDRFASGVAAADHSTVSRVLSVSVMGTTPRPDPAAYRPARDAALLSVPASREPASEAPGEDAGEGMRCELRKRAIEFACESGPRENGIQFSDGLDREAQRPETARNRSVNSTSIRAISAASSSPNCTSLSSCSMVSNGSTKTVCPVALAACTTPWTCRRSAARTGDSDEGLRYAA